MRRSSTKRSGFQWWGRDIEELTRGELLEALRCLLEERAKREAAE